MRHITALIFLFVLTACQQQPPEQSTDSAPAPSATILFTNAIVWDGTGTAPRPVDAIAVRDGRILSLDSATTPADAIIVDLDGAFVIPGLINTHGHVNDIWAGSDVEDAAERVRSGLRLYAKYGVTTVLSLGGEPEAALRVRRAFDPSAPAHARFMLAGPVVAEESAAAARERALANVELGVDWLKLRVDDNLGRGEKMPWDAVEAVIDVGRETGKPVATHIFYLADAARLLDMGSGMIAHSVRDLPVTDAFIESLADAGVCYVPTLTREVSTFVYADRPAFFDDPFFLSHANTAEMARVSAPDFMAEMARSETAAGYRKALTQAMENLRRLSTAGAAIGMGTDSGPAGRFPGYFEHLELQMMVEAGMSPEDALLSATSRAAACIGRTDIGTLEPGKWADFLVLAADPTEDIAATKTLRRVFISGREIR